MRTLRPIVVSGFSQTGKVVSGFSRTGTASGDSSSRSIYGTIIMKRLGELIRARWRVRDVW